MDFHDFPGLFRKIWEINGASPLDLREHLYLRRDLLSVHRADHSGRVHFSTMLKFVARRSRRKVASMLLASEITTSCGATTTSPGIGKADFAAWVPSLQVATSSSALRRTRLPCTFVALLPFTIGRTWEATNPCACNGNALTQTGSPAIDIPEDLAPILQSRGQPH